MGTDQNIKQGTGPRSAEEEFELLMARILWKEAEPADRARLDEMIARDPALKKRHDSYLGTMNFFDGLPLGELGEFALDANTLEYAHSTPPGRARVELDELAGKRDARQKPFQPSNWINIYGSAAAVVLLALTVVLYLKPGSFIAPSPELTARISLVEGSCSTGDKRALKTNDSADVSGGSADIISGPDSFCDLQFPEFARTAFRLLPDSRLSYRREGKSLLLDFQRGAVLLQANKLSGGRRLIIRSGGHSVSVLGTQIRFVKPDQYSLRVEMREGKAEILTSHHLRLNALKARYTGEQLKQLSKLLPELFQENKEVLESGINILFKESPAYRKDGEKIIALLDKTMEEFLPKEPGSGKYLKYSEGVPFNSPLWTKLRKTLDKNKTDAGRLQKIYQPERYTEKIEGERLTTLENDFENFTASLNENSNKKIEESGENKSISVEEQKRKHQAALKTVKKPKKAVILYKFTLNNGQVLVGYGAEYGFDTTVYTLYTKKGELKIRKTDVKEFIEY